MAKTSKDYEPTIKAFEKAHRNPDTLKKRNDAEQVKKELEQKEYFDPQIADEEREKGNGFFKEQKYPEAVKHYSEALRRNPKGFKADICQLGMDQQKVNVLAREYCDDIKRKNKPIILSHHMLPGLQQGQEKMSKSDPSSSIFMEDEEAEVNLKIKKAYCPPQIVEGNPCLDYVKFLIFPWFNEFKVERDANNGGEKIFSTFEELIADYASGKLHPADLKPAIAKSLNKILQPVRDHFRNDP